MVVISLMFAFVSYWRAAALVLRDLAGTAYHIGGIVEWRIGKAGPWLFEPHPWFGTTSRLLNLPVIHRIVRSH